MEKVVSRVYDRQAWLQVLSISHDRYVQKIKLPLKTYFGSMYFHHDLKDMSESSRQVVTTLTDRRHNVTNRELNFFQSKLPFKCQQHRSGHPKMNMLSRYQPQEGDSKMRKLTTSRVVSVADEIQDKFSKPNDRGKL